MKSKLVMVAIVLSISMISSATICFGLPPASPEGGSSDPPIFNILAIVAIAIIAIWTCLYAIAHWSD